MLQVIGLCVSLLILVEGSRAATTPSFNFSGLVFDRTCGLREGQSQWGLEGSVRIADEDLVFFQEKLVFKTCSEVCEVDMTSCGKEAPSPNGRDSSCVCTKKEGDVYNIRLTSTAKLDQSHMTVQAGIPSHDQFGHVASTAYLGTIPTVYERKNGTRATLSVNQGAGREVEQNQTLAVCPDQFTTLEFCVDSPHPGSFLSISLDSLQVFNNPPCVEEIQKFSFESTPEHHLTFSYTPSKGCPYKDDFHLMIEEAKSGCGESTTTPTTTSSSTTASTTKSSSTTAPTTMSSSTTAPTTTSPTTTTTGTTTKAAPLLMRDACRTAFLGQTGSSIDEKVVTLRSGTHVLCNKDKDSSEWVVIQKRTKGDTIFNRNWSEYAQGFGPVDGDFWLGNTNIHELCPDNEHRCQLKIELGFDGEPHVSSRLIGWSGVRKQPDGVYHVLLSGVTVAGETESFRMKYLTASGPEYVRKALVNNQKFSTPDVDNTGRTPACPETKSSGWWWRVFKSCYWAAPNGLWHTGGYTGMFWYGLTGGTSPGYLTWSRLKVRPQTK